ncbi:MAG: transcription termination factor NusA [Candidatus Jidaibacter sp.]|jgi:N utilization substance protein A|nr:transcription termination factor NusA [Candidatus Jidaibacter sp.]
MSQNFGSAEIILIAEAVAREKNIPKDAVIEALEEAIRVAARRKYGHESTIRAEIDRRTGEVKIFREMLVVADDYLPPVEEENEHGHDHDEKSARKQEVNVIRMSEAKHKKADAAEGDIISEQLPAIDLGRVAAQSAKQVIMYRVKEIERDKNYEEFKDRVGKIVSGVVEKVEHSGVLLKIGSAEAVIRNEFLIRDEKNRIKQGDRIRALVYEVNKESKGPQILLSRTHNEFLSELFAQEVPEIYDRIIEIKSIARDPGARAKVAVYTHDQSIDPVGSCVGMRGSRVQAVITELNGEKIDIIEWSNDPATTIVNALAPAEVSKVIIDEDNNRIEVVVPDEQLSIAIGRRGQNVRLASMLIGWDIDVLTEEAESKRRVEEFSAVTQKFMEALDVEEILAQLLASEGYNSIQSIADAAVSDIASVEGLDEAIAQELISRAKDYSLTHDDADINQSQAARVSVELNQAMLDIPNMTEELATKLHAAEINTIQDLADLSRDELLEKISAKNIDHKLIDSVIMAARDKVYFSDGK